MNSDACDTSSKDDYTTQVELLHIFPEQGKKDHVHFFPPHSHENRTAGFFGVFLIKKVAI